MPIFEEIVLKAAIAFLNLVVAGIFSRSLFLAMSLLPDLKAAQIEMLGGVLYGFDFILAGTLLKTLIVKDWQQLLMLVAILLLRTMVKTAFAWQNAFLSKQSSYKSHG